MEADLRRYYGERLADLGRVLSPRRLLVYLRHLPPDSALSRSMNPAGAGWTVEAYLLAAAVDVLQAANWQRQGDDKAKRPAPIPRPGELSEDEQARRRNTEHAKAFRERMRREPA